MRQNPATESFNLSPVSPSGATASFLKIKIDDEEL